MSNIAEKIKQAEDRKTVIHEVEEWGVSLHLVEPTMAEVQSLNDNYLNLTTDGELGEKSNVTMFNWALLALCIHDASGFRVFQTPEEAEETLGGKAARVVGEIVVKCGELAGPPGEEEIQEAEKH